MIKRKVDTKITGDSSKRKIIESHPVWIRFQPTDTSVMGRKLSEWANYVALVDEPRARAQSLEAEISRLEGERAAMDWHTEAKALLENDGAQWASRQILQMAKDAVVRIDGLALESNLGAGQLHGEGCAILVDLSNMQRDDIPHEGYSEQARKLRITQLRGRLGELAGTHAADLQVTQADVEIAVPHRLRAVP
jgi:hypothetical protein